MAIFIPSVVLVKANIRRAHTYLNTICCLCVSKANIASPENVALPTLVCVLLKLISAEVIAIFIHQ